MSSQRSLKRLRTDAELVTAFSVLTEIKLLANIFERVFPTHWWRLKQASHEFWHWLLKDVFGGKKPSVYFTIRRPPVCGKPMRRILGIVKWANITRVDLRGMDPTPGLMKGLRIALAYNEVGLEMLNVEGQELNPNVVLNLDVGLQITEMPDFLGFCASHGVSHVLAVELAKHLPKRSQQRIIEGYTGGTSPCIANDLRRSGLLGGRLWP